MAASTTALEAKRAAPQRKVVTPWWVYLILVLFAAFYLVPIYVAIMTSLKSVTDVTNTSIWQPPTTLSFDNFSKAFKVLGTGFRNSFLLVIPGVIISAVLGSLNGYVLSKWKFRGSNFIFTLILFGMFIPYQSVLIPLVQFMQWQIVPGFSLYATIAGLILTHVIYGIPITTLIFRNYYVSVPTELIESGTVDGAGFFGIYWNIILPLSVPAFVVVMIWQFTAIWNEFLFAVTLNSNPASQPVTVALSGLGSSQAGTDYGMQMAGSLLTALPTLAVYIFLGRYFIRGLLAGSVKG